MMMLNLVVLSVALLADDRPAAWRQWGQNARHTGAVPVVGQKPDQLLGQYTYDPLADAIRIATTLRSPELVELAGDASLPEPLRRHATEVLANLTSRPRA